MSHLPNIVPISDLRQDAAAVLAQLKKSGQPIVITQRGRAAAVLISVAEYEQSQSQLDLLMQLARGEKEIAAGKGYDLDSVLAEADTLLAADE